MQGIRPKIPQLDAVRGIAFLLVLGHNLGGKYPQIHLDWIFAQGWMGVDLFFVLSGFLITGILVETRETSTYFRNFYARRCLRIWPLYYSLLLIMFVAIPFLRPAEGQMIFEKSSPWWAYPLFLQNFVLKYSSLAAGPLGVTWSLAIEEQFYLVWPLVVRFASRRNLKRIAVAILLASPFVRMLLMHTHVDIYTNLICRLDGLMAGSLLAVVLQEANFQTSRWVKPAWITLLVAAPVALVTAYLQMAWIVYSFAALAAVSFIYVAMYSKQAWLQNVLKNRFLLFTGLISYGLYLLHRLAIGAATTLHLDRYPLASVLFVIALSYLLATLSWRFLEQPFLRLKVFFELRPATSRVVSTIPVETQGKLAE